MSECFRCGQEGHRRSECPRDEGTPPAAPQQAAPRYLDAGAYRRPAEEISAPTEEYQRAREQLNGMPGWLARRLKAWHQVAESRRDPLGTRNLCERRLDRIVISEGYRK